jgi:hypothetical protein
MTKNNAWGRPAGRPAFSEGIMIRTKRPCNLAIHLAATRLARQCVSIIEPLLRPEEYAVAQRKFYLAIRESLESLKEGKDTR